MKKQFLSLADVKGADTISVSHVAYKSKLYKVNGKSGSITLEDADFVLLRIDDDGHCALRTSSCLR